MASQPEHTTGLEIRKNIRVKGNLTIGSGLAKIDIVSTNATGTPTTTPAGHPNGSLLFGYQLGAVAGARIYMNRGSATSPNWIEIPAP